MSIFSSFLNLVPHFLKHCLCIDRFIKHFTDCLLYIDINNKTVHKNNILSYYHIIFKFD